MSTTERRLVANRANALRSIGPATAQGKAIASHNATRHGLLSQRLILEDESPEEFSDLVSELQRALVPVGAVELALVERIAIGLWRERRLVAAETAAAAIERRGTEIAQGLRPKLHQEGVRQDSGSELAPVDVDHASWH